MKLTLVVFLATLACCLKAHSAADHSGFIDAGFRAPACQYDADRLEYAGDAQKQAKCLLRHVGKGAKLGDALQTLPAPLNELVGASVNLSRDRLGLHLRNLGISDDEVGGSLDDGLSKTTLGLPAKYFVIHDTSSPFYGTQDFPSDINTSTWSGNNLSNWTHTKVTHVYVNRLGKSVTIFEFSQPWRATKKENRLGKAARGRFIHIECVQPRHTDPHGPNGNDLAAPDEGFTSLQLKRLALLYVVASVRSGQWLIPAFHAVIDSEFENGHDDPQNFDLEKWCIQIAALLKEIN